MWVPGTVSLWELRYVSTRYCVVVGAQVCEYQVLCCCGSSGM